MGKKQQKKLFEYLVYFKEKMNLYNNIIIILILIMFISCAKQSTPMGGPTDEEPPVLISTTPINEATNISPNEIELVFNEYIKLENANNQILITPRINKDEMEILALKNAVRIKLNQELEDSTTYVFNFQKSITDITENNPAENLKLVFSTGSTIDSLIFSGRVSFVFPQKAKLIENVLVGLYPVGDTTDVFSAPPYYIGQADTLGRFEITNIKVGNYIAYAWQDVNNSLKAEEKSEPYGFLNDTINMSENRSGALFYLSIADLSPLKVTRSSTTGSNFDVILSKFPTEVQVKHPDIKEDLYYRTREKTIRFYSTESIADSTAISITLRDSVGFQLDTLVYAKFEKSDRAKEKLETTFPTGKTFINRISTEISFNKPVSKVNFDSLYIKYDTASIIPIESNMVYFKDSAELTKMILEIGIPDSISNETFVVYASDSTFFDVEGMFNEKPVEGSYRRLKKEVLTDALRVTINTEVTPLILQLLNKQGEVVREQFLTSTNLYVFRNLEANTYQLRVIEDENNNRKWDPSNLSEGRQAESVYYFTNPENENSRDIVLKAGWEVDLTVEPLPRSGISASQNLDKREEDLPQKENNSPNIENIR